MFSVGTGVTGTLQAARGQGLAWCAFPSATKQHAVCRGAYTHTRNKRRKTLEPCAYEQTGQRMPQIHRNRRVHCNAEGSVCSYSCREHSNYTANDELIWKPIMFFCLVLGDGKTLHPCAVSRWRLGKRETANFLPPVCVLKKSKPSIYFRPVRVCTNALSFSFTHFACWHLSTMMKSAAFYAKLQHYTWASSYRALRLVVLKDLLGVAAGAVCWRLCIVWLCVCVWLFFLRPICITLSFARFCCTSACCMYQQHTTNQPERHQTEVRRWSEAWMGKYLHEETTASTSRAHDVVVQSGESILFWRLAEWYGRRVCSVV